MSLQEKRSLGFYVNEKEKRPLESYINEIISSKIGPIVDPERPNRIRNYSIKLALQHYSEEEVRTAIEPVVPAIILHALDIGRTWYGGLWPPRNEERLKMVEDFKEMYEEGKPIEIETLVFQKS